MVRRFENITFAAPKGTRIGFVLHNEDGTIDNNTLYVKVGLCMYNMSIMIHVYKYQRDIKFSYVEKISESQAEKFFISRYLDEDIMAYAVESIKKRTFSIKYIYENKNGSVRKNNK